MRVGKNNEGNADALMEASSGLLNGGKNDGETICSSKRSARAGSYQLSAPSGCQQLQKGAHVNQELH